MLNDWTYAGEIRERRIEAKGLYRSEKIRMDAQGRKTHRGALKSYTAEKWNW